MLRKIETIFKADSIDKILAPKQRTFASLCRLARVAVSLLKQFAALIVLILSGMVVSLNVNPRKKMNLKI